MTAEYYLDNVPILWNTNLHSKIETNKERIVCNVIWFEITKKKKKNKIKIRKTIDTNWGISCEWKKDVRKNGWK